jgi:SAM-dependent MidA family methyltransferase
VLDISRRVVADGGAALVIDYGHDESSIGETLQAVGAHAFADPLSATGNVDLTAHVDFHALALAAESMGAHVSGPISQARFLINLGLDKRADALKEHVTHDKATEVNLAVERLTGIGRTGMGTLFKAIAIGDPRLGTLPGFDIWQEEP